MSSVTAYLSSSWKKYVRKPWDKDQSLQIVCVCVTVYFYAYASIGIPYMNRCECVYYQGS